MTEAQKRLRELVIAEVSDTDPTKTDALREVVGLVLDEMFAIANSIRDIADRMPS